MRIRTVVIEDSAAMRARLVARLAGATDIEVAGLAASAAEGRAMIRRLDPDVVLLAVEMPGMNGLEFLEKIMSLRPTPVIVVSETTRQGAETTARALALGAADCYSMSDRSGSLLADDKGKLANLIRQAAQVRLVRQPHSGNRRRSASERPAKARTGNEVPGLIAVGSSTGGVAALQILLAGFPADCPPVVIVQHVNPRFAPAIARTLDRACPARVQLAEPDMRLLRGNVYLAPGDHRHLTIAASRSRYCACLRPGERVSGHLPSVDVLFESVAAIAGPNAAGILLTGMGADGARGLLSMARAGAITVAQDQASCTVFGMPRAAIALGAAGRVAPIDQIAQHVLGRAA